MPITRPAKLRDILNCTENAHKIDVYNLARGHLNENKILKDDLSYKKRKTWSSAQKPHLQIKPRHHFREYKDEKTEEEMRVALMQFIKGISFPSRPKKVVEKEESRSLCDFSNDDVLIEDYMKRSTDLPIITSSLHAYSAHKQPHSTKFLRTVAPMCPMPKTQSEADVVEEVSSAENIETFQSLLKLRDLSVIPTSVYGALKTDQFIKRKKYLNKVANKEKLQCLLKTTESLDAVQTILQQTNCVLPCYNGSSEKRLDVFKKSFDLLIGSSPNYGDVLQQIKNEYDRYIEHLKIRLNSTSHHELVQTQVEQLTVGGCCNPEDVKHAANHLQEIELEAEKLLQENQSLRDELRGEMYSSSPDTLLDGEHMSHKKIKIPKSDDIEHVKAKILEKMDALKIISDQKIDFVPASVCSNLDNCIKETEIEMQKLISQNDYISISTTENESSLTRQIQNADTSDADAIRIWQCINSPTFPEEAGLLEKSYHVSNEEHKWTWYIS